MHFFISPNQKNNCGMFSVEHLQAVLNTKFLGREVKYLPKTLSTNDDAWECFQTQMMEGILIIAGNQVVRSPVSTLDILPTLFKLVGVEIPANHSLDGRDIRPSLNARRFPGKVKPFTHLYSYIDNRVSAIRQGPWKLSVEIGSQLGKDYGFTASYSQPLLFQVEQDLGERIDRASEHPEVVTRMLKILRNYENRIQESGNFWTRK